MCVKFFDSKVHNLYVFVRKGEEERFHLFVYKEPMELRAAYELLLAAIEANLSDDHVIHISPELAAEESVL